MSHLGVETIDSYLLHGPSMRTGIAREDWDAWRAMETIHSSGRTRMLGVSNVTAEQLRILFAGARVKPRFVQNRSYASRGWDREVRSFCTANGIVYQGFSLLTANRAAMTHSDLTRIAVHHGCGAGPLVFRFALALEIIALTGTTSAEHMRADLDAFRLELDPAEIATIEGILSPR